MSEIHEIGLLCKFVKLSKTADIMIEFHSVRLTGMGRFQKSTKKSREDLQECGVEAWWA